jgi:enoyl-CoA hydratase
MAWRRSLNYLSDLQTILTEKRERVLRVTLNRPERLNAVDALMHAELSEIFDRINRDVDIDVVVLTGAGRAFSAGGDANWMKELVVKPREWQRKAVESRRLWVSLMDLEKPLICRLNGPARGMCATIVALCDIVIASDSATLADTHTNMALAAADGANVIWPLIIGFHRAKDLLLTGRVLSARDAEKLGLVNVVVAPDELDATVDDYVAKLAAGPMRALQWTKMSVNFQLKQIVLPALENALNLLEMSNFHPDHLEAVQAFTEKRPPNYQR